MRPPTGEMMLVSSAWLTVWHRRFCVALCCTGLHRWLRGEILANLTIKAQRLDNKLPGDGGTEGLHHRAVLADSGCIMLHRLHWMGQTTENDRLPHEKTRLPRAFGGPSGRIGGSRMFSRRSGQASARDRRPGTPRPRSSYLHVSEVVRCSAHDVGSKSTKRCATVPPAGTPPNWRKPRRTPTRRPGWRWTRRTRRSRECARASRAIWEWTHC